MPKWEYCMIDGVQGENTSEPCFYIFTEFGWESVDFAEKSPTVAPPMNGVAQLIARLGDEGWEMVGTASTGEYIHCLYFKRLKP